MSKSKEKMKQEIEDFIKDSAIRLGVSEDKIRKFFIAELEYLNKEE